MSALTVEDFIYFEKQVIKWNAIIGNSAKDSSLNDLHQTLSIEELTGDNELVASYYKKDLVGILDGLCDQIFVGFFYAVIQQNGAQFSSIDKSYIKNVLSFGAGEYNLSVVFRNMDERLIQNDAVTAQNFFFRVLNEYKDTFDIRRAFDEVLRSNMSKFSLKDNVDIEKEISYIESQGEYGDVHAQVVGYDGVEYVVFRALKDLRNGREFGGLGKLVKPSTFSEPELAPFIK